jgi:His/Glu/Gln/Arg/opine family amino acid ABC transporter permease subunit
VVLIGPGKAMDDRHKFVGSVKKYQTVVAVIVVMLVAVAVAFISYPALTSGDTATVIDSLDELLHGALLTIEISVVAIMFGLGMGIVVGLSRVSKNKVIWGLATAYVEVIRGTPLVVQIFIWAFVVPQLINYPRFPSMLAGLIALGMHSSAYQGEIFRGGIQAVPTGQYEAARSLGVSHLSSMLYVILPQAFRNALPALNNEFIIVIKDSSLLYAIGVVELFATAQRLVGATLIVIPFYLGVAIIYLTLTLTLSRTLAVVEKRIRIPGLGVAS